MQGFAGNICPHCGAVMGELHRPGCRLFGCRVGDSVERALRTMAAPSKKADTSLRETALRLAREAGFSVVAHDQPESDACCWTARTDEIEALVRAAMAQERERIIEAADAARKRFSETYQENIAAGWYELTGNMDWARLEGAVNVVQAIRAMGEHGEES